MARPPDRQKFSEWHARGERFINSGLTDPGIGESVSGGSDEGRHHQGESHWPRRGTLGDRAPHAVIRGTGYSSMRGLRNTIS